jgi:hypothetical protein
MTFRREWWARIAGEAFAWAGASAAVYGVALLAPWAAWIVGGVLLSAYGVFLSGTYGARRVQDE